MPKAYISFPPTLLLYGHRPAGQIDGFLHKNITRLTRLFLLSRRTAEKIKNFASMYLVDITEVPDFNKMYELYDPCTIMFFYRNKHIMIDLGE